MPNSDPSLRDRLLAEHEEYRRLHAEPHDFETRLSALAGKPVLSDDEQLEEVTLKKKKLHLKDRMEAIAREARATVQS